MAKLSIDELLAKAEEKEKKRVRIENNVNTLKYIERVGWESGTVAIPTYVIFWHYRTQYDGTHITSKVGKTTFFRTFSKRFPAYRKNSQRYYLLKEGIIELTPELLKTCKSYDKQHWQKKPRKKKSLQLLGQEGNDSN
jgi:hypothetical protein